MNIRHYFARYALARWATFATVATLLAMLLLSGLTLAALFARDQIEQGRIAALLISQPNMTYCVDEGWHRTA